MGNRRACGNCGSTLYPNGTCPHCDRPRIGDGDYVEEESE